MVRSPTGRRFRKVHLFGDRPTPSGALAVDAVMGLARDGLTGGKGSRPGGADEETCALVTAAEEAGERPALVEGAIESRLGGVLEVVDRVRGRPAEPVLAEHLARERLTRLRVGAALARAGEALDGAGVGWLVVKGPAVARLWPAPTRRGFNDLDLLVEPGRVAVAVDALVEAGARELHRNWEGVRRYEVAEFPLLLAGAQIDLHADLVGLGRHRRHIRFGTTGVLARRRWVETGAGTVPVPDPVDEVIHLCVHAGLGGATRLGQLRDIAAAVAVLAPEPDTLAARAREVGARHLCAHVLDRVGRLLGPDPGVSPLVNPLVAALDAPVTELALRRWGDRSLRQRARRRAGVRIGRGWWVRSRRDTVGATAADLAWWGWRRGAARLGMRVPSWDVDDPDSPLYWGRESGDDGARGRYLAWLAELAGPTGPVRGARTRRRGRREPTPPRRS